MQLTVGVFACAVNVSPNAFIDVDGLWKLRWLTAGKLVVCTCDVMVDADGLWKFVVVWTCDVTVDDADGRDVLVDVERTDDKAGRVSSSELSSVRARIFGTICKRERLFT